VKVSIKRRGASFWDPSRKALLMQSWLE
jgi:hypothetical protein